MPKQSTRNDPKAAALVRDGTLNPSPDKVTDPKFREGDFFDPRDAVQVKYEMLRRVSLENVSITDATVEYGCVAPNVLPSEGELRRSRISGTGSEEEGPSRGPTSCKATS